MWPPAKYRVQGVRVTRCNSFLSYINYIIWINPASTLRSTLHLLPRGLLLSVRDNTDSVNLAHFSLFPVFLYEYCRPSDASDHAVSEGSVVIGPIT